MEIYNNIRWDSPIYHWPETFQCELNAQIQTTQNHKMKDSYSELIPHKTTN